MGISVQFIPKSPSLEKSTIMMVVYHKAFTGGRFKFYLAPVIMKDWNSSKQRSKTDRVLNETLEGLKLEIETIFHRQLIKDRRVLSSDWLRAEVSQLIGKPEEVSQQKKPSSLYPSDFFELWEYIIDRTKIKDRPIAEKSKRTKRNSIIWGKKYAKASSWIPSVLNIDKDFYDGFTTYLVEQGISVPGKHIKEIKSLLHQCEDRDIKVNQAFKKKFFMVVFKEKESIYLTRSEIDKILALDLPRRLSDVRDNFIMACFCGLRYSDWHMIHPTNVIKKEGKEFLVLTVVKTKDAITIPLHPIIKQIFEKHNNNRPRLLSNSKSNMYLKEIAEIADLGKVFLNGSIVEKSSDVQNHTSRRTFATNAYLSGMPSQLIMSLTGHKKESSFKRYLKLGSAEQSKLASESLFFQDVTMKLAV